MLMTCSFMYARFKGIEGTCYVSYTTRNLAIKSLSFYHCGAAYLPPTPLSCPRLTKELTHPATRPPTICHPRSPGQQSSRHVASRSPPFTALFCWMPPMMVINFISRVPIFVLPIGIFLATHPPLPQ
jgi:hypothetical protein